MAARNHLISAPPHQVEASARRLGQNLKTARLRRNLSLVEIASRLGVDRHVVADAEKGKLTTGIAVYLGLLWAMDLLGPVSDIAAPERDEEGLALSIAHDRERARRSGGLDNDF